MRIWKSVDRFYTVRISDDALREIGKLAKASAPLETGTPLIGEYSVDQWTADVLSIGPVPSDSSKHRFGFRRGIAGLKTLFASIFRESNGRRHYVGEWHSHPGGIPIPSRTDDENMFEIAKDVRSRCPECILIIASVTGDNVTIRAYVYSARLARVDLVESSTE